MPADTRQIFISFPIPVELSREDERELRDLVGRICKRYEAEHPGRVMWAAGYGGLCTSMPITAEDDVNGVPLDFDMSVLHIEVAERENYKWPCAKCGQRQDEHDHVVIGGTAAGCEFEPAPPKPPPTKGPRTTMIDFNIKNRWSGEVMFTAPIAADENTPFEVKMGLAVKWALDAKKPLAGADLAWADLAGADLTGADLTGADLYRANFTEANLNKANLNKANLNKADLNKANLAEANLAGANLTEADLTEADLDGANLASTNLTGANLTGASW